MMHVCVALGLLSLFILIASPLWLRTIEATKHSQRRQRHVFLADRVSDQMRLDVWQARAFESPEDTKLVLQYDDRRVIWRVHDSGHLTRHATSPNGAGNKQTHRLDVRLQFETTGSTVRVHGPRQSVTMASQYRLWHAKRAD